VASEADAVECVEAEALTEKEAVAEEVDSLVKTSTRRCHL